MTDYEMTVMQILSREKLKELRDAGFVVIHREPTDHMISAFYAGQYPEMVTFKEGFHRMVACSINQQNKFQRYVPEQDLKGLWNIFDTERNLCIGIYGNESIAKKRCNELNGVI